MSRSPRPSGHTHRMLVEHPHTADTLTRQRATGEHLAHSARAHRGVRRPASATPSNTIP